MEREDGDATGRVRADVGSAGRRASVARLGVVTIAALLLGPRPAGASGMGMFDVKGGVYALPGFVGAASIHDVLPIGGVVGGELSVVALLDDDHWMWVGGFVDAVWDTGPGETRISVGPELGFGPFGMDIAFTAGHLDGWYHGVSTRLFFTMAFVAFYGRYGHLFGHPGEADYGEAGLLLKVPIPLMDL